MTGSNKFLPFGTGSSPNVIGDAAYAALTARPAGFLSGVAQSQQLNKVWRQSSVAAAVMGQIIANNGVDATDSDSITTLVTNLLAAIMAGNGTTPPQFDNDNLVATTAFVQRALGNTQKVIPVTANTTLAQGDLGSFVEISGGSNITVTLPSTTGMGGRAFYFYSNVGSPTTIAAATGQNLNLGVSNLSSFQLAPGGNAILITDGTSWEVLGEAMLPYSAVMSGANWNTPPQFDDTTKLATTAFVRRASGNLRTQTVIGSSTTLSASNAGTMVVVTGTGTAVGLPKANTVLPGTAFYFSIEGTGVAIGTQVGDSTTLPTTSPLIGDRFIVSTDGYNVWRCLSYTGAGLEPSSKAQTGYTKMQNGIILQWGRVNAGATGGVYDVAFPVTFPNAGFVGVATDFSNNVVGADINAVEWLNTTNMRVWCSTNADGANESNFWWFAVGY